METTPEIFYEGMEPSMTAQTISVQTTIPYFYFIDGKRIFASSR